MDERHELKATLQALRGQRDAAQSKLARIELEIGRVAGPYVAVDPSHGYSSVGRIVGVSHTHSKKLIDRAKDAANLSATEHVGQGWQAPILHRAAAARYLQETGHHIINIFASFEEADVLWYTQLPPSTFQQSSEHLWIPHMALQLDNNEWLGIDGVNVGYGGSGGSAAEAALREIGIPAEIAAKISTFRVSETNVATGDVDGTPLWPRYPLGRPRSIDTGRFYVYELGSAALKDGPGRKDTSGFYPTVPAGSQYQQIIHMLNGKDLPPWATGTRRARIFLRNDEAVSQGFAEGFSTAPLIIEQGQLQLWLKMFPPKDKTQLLDDTSYDALDAAGLYPDELAAHDARGGLRRALNRRFGKQWPAYYDIGPDEAGLQFTPYKQQQ